MTQDTKVNISTNDEKAFNIIHGLIQKKAPIYKPNETLTPDEVLDYFVKSPDINTNNDKVIDGRDNLALLIRIHNVNVQPNDKSIQSSPEFKRTIERISAAKQLAGELLNKITTQLNFPQIQGRLITKTEVRKMLERVYKNSDAEYRNDPNNKTKKKTYDYLKLYLELFDKTPEKSLWLKTDKKTITSANYEPTEDGKALIYPGLNQGAMTAFWNCFTNQDIQKIFTAAIYKESIHLEHMKDKTKNLSDIDIYFVNQLKISSKEPDKILITPELVESAKWLVGTGIHEEYIGYKEMINWLKTEGFTSKKLSDMLTKFRHIPSIEDACFDLEKYFSGYLRKTDGMLDEAKFEKRFIEMHEEKFKGNPSKIDSRFLLALRIIYKTHEHKQKTGEIKADDSYTSFIDASKYCDLAKYPEKLKTK